MNILSLHQGHDGAVTILSGNEIVVHHQLDRFNGHKHQSMSTPSLFEKIKNLNLKFDRIITTSIGTNDPITKDLFLKHFGNESKIIDIGQSQHHIFHAVCAKHFFQLKKDFVIIVADGGGAFKPFQNESKYLNGARLLENESIYDENFNSLFQKFGCDAIINLEAPNTKIHPSVSLGGGYTNLVHELGLDYSEEGKAMALSSHGKFKKQIFRSLIDKDVWSSDLLCRTTLLGTDPGNKFNRFMLDPSIDHLKKGSQSLDFVHSFQKAFEYLFLKTLKKVDTKNKKIILTGGCAQNVLNNSNISRKLPNEILVDPYNGDFGISLGSAIRFSEEKIKPLRHICSGFSVKYDLSSFSNFTIRKNITPSYVAKILIDETVGIFSGKSEQGQRGLGFRSLLANPLKDKNIENLNFIKKREWYRPFACTVLKEKAKKYFDMGNINESPYMMFVFKCRDKKLKNVCSVDGYSRIQTLDKNFHPKYYQLIKAFERVSGYPIILNTSLNLPGSVLCEDYEDLYNFFKESNLNYCYLPDTNELICRN